MILRIGLLTDEGMIPAPCGQVLPFLNPLNVSFKLTVDGTVIADTNDLSTYVFPVAVVTVANSITVNNMGLDGSSPYFRINLPNIWDKTNIQIEVSKAGLYSYSKTFEVYGYDLGDTEANILGNTTQNPAFRIYMIENNNNVNGEQTLAYANLIAYRKPFTNKIFYYDAVSSGGDKIYTASSGATISGNDGYFCDGAIDITQVNNVYNIIACNRVLVDTCTYVKSVGVNTNVATPFNTEVDCNDCPEDSTECCEECDTLVEVENTATTYIAYENLSLYWVNDIQVYPFNLQELTYNLYDYNGVLIQTLTYNYGINPPTFVYDFTTTRLSNFIIPEVGDYLLEVILTTPDLRTCTHTYKIKNCNWYEVEQIECNQYKVHNRSFDPITLTINKLNDDREFELVSTHELDLLSYYSVTLDTDGIYTFNVTRDTVTYTYIVIVYCNLKACLLDKLQHLICANENNLCKSQDYYDFNALVLNAHTYFAMLNNEYNFNFIYTALTPNKLEELYQINDFITRFEEYCLECDPNCEDCAKTNLNCTDCG